MFEALGPMPELLPEFRELHREFRAEIEKSAARRHRRPALIRADVDPTAQAVLLLRCLRGIAFQWLLDPDAFSLDAAYEELKRDLRRTLAP